MEDVVVVTMSEFGRTAKENGNRGTDHGHANAMFVMGGPVKGGKVYGQVARPGSGATLRRAGPCPDHRFSRHPERSRPLSPGQPSLKSVFPNYVASPEKFLNLPEIVNRFAEITERSRSE